MNDNQSKGISYTSGFFILIVFVIGGALFANIIASLILKAVPENVNVLRSLQAITAIIAFFLPAVVTAKLLHYQPFQLLGFTGKVKREQIGLVVLITGTALIVSTSLAYFNNEIPVPDSWKEAFEKMENEYNSNVEKIVSMKSVSDYIIALVVMGFIPALCEETLFRGGLQNFLSKGTGKPWLAIVVVSILFSLAHFSYYGFFVRVFLGIVLGAIFHYSGRLWLCILAHFLNNALAMTILFDHMQKGKPISDALKSNPSTWWGILILPVVIGLFILFKRISVANRRTE